jgi:hypothetical protein
MSRCRRDWFGSGDVRSLATTLTVAVVVPQAPRVEQIRAVT